ncbi:hypothetical protein GCM10011613_36760 [Cellvibrio zantedeschiae]|uniref:Uncharacterized protein n=1 Tax=Cellvibrio zantedeschiae TaxID=1237077 RepID=A0ABQ3BDK3_9GAMM|nr:hypothetical protein [Cellvibrio zantedeschiae]GGY88360.1 hypothetical protein GCM10011613_36760 [Cellvibrio zantedeschiae]
MNDKLINIRQLIANAKQREGASAQLSRLLSARANHLHEAIKLPTQEAEELLAEFVIRYIAQVPEFIEAISDITKEAGIFDGILPLLNIASDYFLAPPDIIGNHAQLEALLDEAYLAHRLLEEVNDRFIGYCGIPLAPMDMTRANVIAHELIGEPYANELDQAVLFSAELLLNQYSFAGESFKHYIALHKSRGWSQELQRWPCLTEDLAIVLDFSNNLKDTVRH